MKLKSYNLSLLGKIFYIFLREVPKVQALRSRQTNAVARPDAVIVVVYN
jgi:hypothetical protein